MTKEIYIFMLILESLCTTDFLEVSARVLSKVATNGFFI